MIVQFLRKSKPLFVLAVLLTSFVLAAPLYAHAGISQLPLMQQASGGCSDCDNSASVNFGQAVTVGNLIVVGVSTTFEPIDPLNVFSLSDTLNSTFTAAVINCVAPAQESRTAIFTATAPSTGSDSVGVVVNVDESVQSIDIFVYELSGVTAAGITIGTGQGYCELVLSPIIAAGAVHDSEFGCEGTAVATSSTSFSNLAFLLGVVGVASLADPSFGAGAGYTATPPTSGSGAGFAEYSTNSVAAPSSVTSPTTFPANLGGGDYFWTEVGVAFSYPSQSLPSCPSTSGGVLVPAGATYTDQSGNTWTVLGGNYVTSFFPGPISNVPAPVQQGFGGEYVTYNGQQGWIFSYSCSGGTSAPPTTSTTSTTTTSTTTTQSCPTTTFADSASFTTSGAFWGANGNYQGVSVPVTNCWGSTLSLNIFVTLKSGTSTNVLIGSVTLASGQTATVFCIDFTGPVPAGTYAVTFSADTTTNEPASAPTIPIVLST
jgi:hypothetical protein